MSQVDNSPNVAGFELEASSHERLIALTATTPTKTIKTELSDLGEVRKNGVLGVLDTDFTFSGGVFAPKGATANDVYLIQLVNKVLSVRPD